MCAIWNTPQELSDQLLLASTVGRVTVTEAFFVAEPPLTAASTPSAVSQNTLVRSIISSDFYWENNWGILSLKIRLFFYV